MSVIRNAVSEPQASASDAPAKPAVVTSSTVHGNPEQPSASIPQKWDPSYLVARGTKQTLPASSPAAVRAVFANDEGLQRLVADIWPEIEKAEQEHAALQKHRDRWNNVRANEEHARLQQRRFDAAVESGDFEAMEREQVLPDVLTFQEGYRKRSYAIARAQAKIVLRVLPLVRKVGTEYANAAKRVAEKIREDERELCNRYGCLFTGSQSAAFIASTVSGVHYQTFVGRQDPLQYGGTPKGLLKGLEPAASTVTAQESSGW